MKRCKSNLVAQIVVFLHWHLPQTCAMAWIPQNQEMMCRHFVSCLEKGKMTPFPNTAKRVPFHLAMQKTKVPIFCICRLPYDKEEYIRCCKCHAWYHTGCVKVPEWAVNTKRKWGSQKCKDDIALKPKTILASIIQQ